MSAFTLAGVDVPVKAHEVERVVAWFRLVELWGTNRKHSDLLLGGCRISWRRGYLTVTSGSTQATIPCDQDTAEALADRAIKIGVEHLTTTCRLCGEELVRRTTTVTAHEWCRTAEREAALAPRPCVVCGTVYKPASRQGRACSWACRRVLRNEYHARYNAKREKTA